MNAHRLMYQLWVGPIPDGLTIDHLQDPAHDETLGGFLQSFEELVNKHVHDLLSFREQCWALTECGHD